MSASEITSFVVQAAEVGIVAPFAVWTIDALFSMFIHWLKGLKQ